LCVLGLSSVVQNPPAPAVPSQRPPHLIHPTRCRRRPPATPPSATPGNAVAPPLHTGPSRNERRSPGTRPARPLLRVTRARFPRRRNEPCVPSPAPPEPSAPPPSSS